MNSSSILCDICLESRSYVNTCTCNIHPWNHGKQVFDLSMPLLHVAVHALDNRSCLLWQILFVVHSIVTVLAIFQCRNWWCQDWIWIVAESCQVHLLDLIVTVNDKQATLYREVWDCDEEQKQCTAASAQVPGVHAWLCRPRWDYCKMCLHTGSETVFSLRQMSLSFICRCKEVASIGK